MRVDENTPAGEDGATIITAPSAGFATRYSLAAGVYDNVHFTVDEDDGEVRFKQSPDYENPHDGSEGDPKYAGNNVYQIIVTVSVLGTSSSYTEEVGYLVHVNDIKPTASNAMASIDENGDYDGFTATQFNFMDSDGGSLASIVIATLPDTGTLRIGSGGAALTANARVMLDDIANLIYTPADSTASANDSFSFRVSNGTSDSAETYDFELDYNVPPDMI